MSKILVVDDEEGILEMLKYSLEGEGYVVITANTGKLALNWIKEIKPDLAIIDLGLPDINGMEVCRVIKDNPKTSAVPIIILTGNSSNEARIEGNLAASVELFLNKPITPEELKKAVALIFEKVEQKRLLFRASLKRTRASPNY